MGKRNCVMVSHGIDLDSEAIREFCKKWKIRELSVFGSILRDDFRPDSDVDFLAVVDDPASDEFDSMEAEEELSTILCRDVDLVEKDGLKWVIRDRVLDSARVVYAA